ncbi:2-keto-4-pentenoate hydratase [Roseiterribacter gracilis]
MDTAKTNALAAQLLADMGARTKYKPLRLDGATIDADTAYEVQRQVVQHAQQAGAGQVAGYKIGLTSGAMQRFCGVDEPILGRLLTGRQVQSGTTVRRADFVRLGLESELALRIAKPFPAMRDGNVFALLECIDQAAAAFEIVDDRDADYSSLDAYSIAAENSWNAGMILGPPISARELGSFGNLQGRLLINGAEVAQGNSSDVLGSPLNVMAWLGRFAQRAGFSLEPGQWVLTGSMIATKFPAVGDRVRFELGSLPPVEISVV